MEKRCTQTTSSLASTTVASRVPTPVASVSGLRGAREGVTEGSVPTACGAAAVASLPPPDVMARIAANAASYEGAAAILPHARRPSPRCFVPALSRRLAAPAVATDAPSLIQMTCKPSHAVAQTISAVRPANPSSTWAPPAVTSRKRTCTEDSRCCFLALGRPPLLGKGTGGSATETSSATTCVSSSNPLERGNHISADIMAAGSNRSSNSSVSTTAAAASSWGASSEDGGDGTSDHQQPHNEQEQRPPKLFRTAISRGCFCEGLGPYEEESTHPHSETSVLLHKDTTVSETIATHARLPCRSTPLPLLSNVPTSSDQPPQQVESASTSTSFAVVEAVAEATANTAYNSRIAKNDSTAKASSKKTLVNPYIRGACAIAARAGGGRDPAISWSNGAGALSGSSAVSKQHFKSGTTATGKEARLLKQQQQQAKLRFKAVAALTAARGACSITGTATGRGEDVRRNDKKHCSLFSLTATSTSSYPRQFPISAATANSAVAVLNSRNNGPPAAETGFLSQQHGYSFSRGTKGLHNHLMCSSDTSILGTGGMERSMGGIGNQNNSRAGMYRCTTTLTTIKGAGRAAVSSPSLFPQQRGTSMGSAGGYSGLHTRPASHLLDKTFGSVSERCRLLICDTSAAYGEDAGLDNVHNTKLAQFCYDQAAFKADKTQPGDYTVNSRRLTPEGRDLLVCVVNKVAAQLAQNTAATAAASSANAPGNSSASSSQVKGNGYTTPTSDPLSPRAAATVAIAIQLFDRFMQVVYQNDLHYGIGAEHCLHPLHGLSALAALPTIATTGGGGGTGSASAAAPPSAGVSGALSNRNYTHSSNKAANSYNTGGSNSVSYSLLNQLIAIACFCFADRVEAIYAYEYAAVLEAWRQQSPVGLTQAWKLAGATGVSGGGGQLSTAVLKEKLMHIERKIISHVPPNGGNVSVAPISELVESLLNVAVQFAAADVSTTSTSASTGEDGALSEASTAPSPTSVSKSKDSHRIENNKDGSKSETNSTLSRRCIEQQERGSSTTHQGTILSLLQRREAAAGTFPDPAEKRELEVQQSKQLPSQKQKDQMLQSHLGVGGVSAVAEAGELFPAFSRCTEAGMITRGNSARRVFSALCYDAGHRAVSTIAASSCSSACVAAVAGGGATKEQCRQCQREWLPSQGEEAAFYRSPRVCRSCLAKKLQSRGLASAEGAAACATTTPLNTRLLPKDAAVAKDAPAITNPYALRVRMSGSSCSDVPRLIAQLLVRLGQLDRRICLDFRPSVIAAAAVHIALLPRQGDPTQRFSPLSPAARAIAVKAVVAAGGAACYRLVRRCQSMLMHKWVKVRGAMAIVQRGNNAAGNSSAADLATSASGATSTTGGVSSACSGGTGSGVGTSGSAEGKTSCTVSLPERLVAEWALSRLTLPAHRHMLEVLHHLADIWTTYAAASIRSRAAAAVAAAAAAARKQQQQARAAPGDQETTGNGAPKKAAPADAQQPDANVAPVNRTAEVLFHKCSSSSSNMGGGGHAQYKHQYFYQHRPGKSRNCSNATSADDFLSATLKTEGEARRRAGGIGTGPTPQGLLVLLSRKDENSRSNALAPKAKLLPPLNSALPKNAASLHGAGSCNSINAFPTFAGLQKELRMMERASISLRRLQKLSLEAAGREDKRNQPLLQ